VRDGGVSAMVLGVYAQWLVVGMMRLRREVR
jgi:hypothetical protein